MLLPPIGGLIYLFTQVFSKRDLNKVQNNLTHVINPTKRVNDLRKQLNFSDTFQNRVNLANALLDSGDYDSAINEYKKALKGDHAKDPGVIKKLMEALYYTSAYDKIVENAEIIKDRSDFEGSRWQFFYGLSLDQLGYSNEAEKNLYGINKRYSNYSERYLLAKFLIEKGKSFEAKEILSTIITESEHMSKSNKKLYRQVILDVKKLEEQL